MACRWQGSLVAVAGLVLVGGELRAQAGWQVGTADRVVAVADVHGAYDAFVRVLQRASVIDSDGGWSGGTTHLVIVGDVLDRGPDSRRALDLIMRLQSEAGLEDGRVLMVLGNHEVMNLTGDLRYVAPGEYAAFADDESEAMRSAAFERFRVALADRGDPEPERAAFDSAYPPGFFAHRAAFAPDGRYGSWLLDQPLLIVVNEVAFVHGGLAEAVLVHGPGLNAALGGELREYVGALESLVDAGILHHWNPFHEHTALLAAHSERTEAVLDETLASATLRIASLQSSGDLFSPDGVVWYRGNVSCNRLTEQGRLSAALAGIGARQLVVGHTPTPGAVVLSRMGEQLLRVDTGMLNEYYGGRASALIIENGEISAVYEDEDEASAPVPQPRRVGLRPDSMSAEALESLLLRAEIEMLGEFDNTATLVRLTDGNLALTGILTRAAGEDVRPAVAAYRLDRLLGLDMVPVTVARNDADGEPGSLQFWPEQSINEIERRAGGLGGSAWCPLADQFRDMIVFDLLAFNEARTAERIRYSSDNFQLLLVGHDRAFATARGRPDHLADVSIELTPAWREALAALDGDMLSEALGDVLDRRRIRALLARRDALLDAAR